MDGLQQDIDSTREDLETDRADLAFYEAAGHITEACRLRQKIDTLERTLNELESIAGDFEGNVSYEMEVES